MDFLWTDGLPSPMAARYSTILQVFFDTVSQMQPHPVSIRWVYGEKISGLSGSGPGVNMIYVKNCTVYTNSVKVTVVGDIKLQRSPLQNSNFTITHCQNEPYWQCNDEKIDRWLSSLIKALILSTKITNGAYSKYKCTKLQFIHCTHVNGDMQWLTHRKQQKS